MSKTAFEVKSVDIISVVISQGGDLGLINNETENCEGECCLILVSFVFHFFGETT